MLLSLAVLSQVLRTVLLAGGALVVALAGLDWAVRTRRLSPFSGVARFMRGRVEPRMAGIERLVVRSGGHPSATPWWMVLAYMVVALLLLALAGTAVDVAQDLLRAMSSGAPGLFVLAIRWTFGFLTIALMVRVLSSWIPSLAHSRWTRWSIGATDWLLGPIRQVLPPFGPVDVSPIVAYFALQVARWLVVDVLLRSLW